MSSLSKRSDDSALAGILKDIDMEGRGAGGAMYKGQDLLRDYEGYGKAHQTLSCSMIKSQRYWK
jgi:hypothetical protein